MTPATTTITIARTAGTFHLLAACDLATGATILRIDGVERPVPTRHTVQIGPGIHVDAPADLGLEALLDAYPFRYLQHSCDPSARILGQNVVTVLDLRRGDPVTFDYDTTEYEMAAPFDCECGSSRCRGRIRGYKFLAAAERQRIAPLVAPHVLLAAGAAVNGATPRDR